MCLQKMSESEVEQISENDARELFERVRWGGCIVCPYCKSKSVTQLKSLASHDGILCNTCKKEFSVFDGTVLQGMHLTYRQWVRAFHLVCSNKKTFNIREVRQQMRKEFGVNSFSKILHIIVLVRSAIKNNTLKRKINDETTTNTILLSEENTD